MLKTVIPFGPQHPVLPEPIHLQLTVEEEIITAAVPAMGFIHRGLETLADRRDFHQMIQVVERWQNLQQIPPDFFCSRNTF